MNGLSAACQICVKSRCREERSGFGGLVEVILQNVDKLETHRRLSIGYGDRLRPQSPYGGAMSAHDGSLESTARLG